MIENAKTVKSGTNEDTSREDEEKTPPVTLSLTMDKRIELAVAGAVVLLGVFILIAASDIPEGKIPDLLTSRGMPYLTGIALILGGIIVGTMRLAIWSVLPGHLVPSEGHEDDKRYPASWIHPFAILLSAWLSVWLQPSLGYLIATPLFLFVTLLILNVRSWGKLIGFPILFPLAAWYVFSQLLGVLIPLGFATPFARSIGLVP